MHSLYYESAAMIIAFVMLGKYLETLSKGKGTEGEKFGMLRTAEDVVNYLGVVPEKIPDLFWNLLGDKSGVVYQGVTKE